MRLAVIGGAGYVGLTTAVCLASKGHTAYCVDANEEKIRQLRSGKPVIYEESLEELLRKDLNEGLLIPSTNLKDAVHDSQLLFICVGTPSRDDGSIDLSQVENVSKEVGLVLGEHDGYKVVVVKSTVVPGTTENLVIPTIEKLSNKRAGLEFGVCMNPEFLKEGRAIRDFLSPRNTGIVIGELDKKSGDLLSEAYVDFEAEVFRTTIRTAEMIKYARNSYLAKDVSFANEMANICQRIGVDYLEVKEGMEMDARIGKGRFLNAGAGFGGSCFPKDVEALIAKAKSMGIRPKMLEATVAVNEDQPYETVKMLGEIIGEVKGKKVAILGLAFKRDTDDMREAPSVKIIKELLLRGARVIAYDPKAIENAKRVFGKFVSFRNTAREALKEADACIIVTDWEEFANPDLYGSMKGRTIIDGRRILNSNKLGEDFQYYAIGLPKPSETQVRSNPRLPRSKAK